MLVNRRVYLTGLAGLVFSACGRRTKNIYSGDRTNVIHWPMRAPWGQGHVVVLVPKTTRTDQTFPVLVACHGRGEALKSPREGALGWVSDYELGKAVERLHAPPLNANDFHGYIQLSRLQEINRVLAQEAFRDIVIVCPYFPDRSPYGRAAVDAGRWLIDDVLPKVLRETPSRAERRFTGIDGVSMGGAFALRIGTLFPERFHAVGGLQPAVSPETFALITEQVVAARRQYPEMVLRLLTSDEDYFRESVSALAGEWRSRGINHTYTEVIGPHDYVFNQGPGAYELLLWYSRVLHG